MAVEIRNSTLYYIGRLVLKMAHKVFVSTVKFAILHVRPLAMCCPIEGMSFGLCPMMMSHSETEKGWLKDDDIRVEFQQHSII